MADDGSKQSPDIWPVPKFRFVVMWGKQKMSFQEVSGLDAEAQIIEYRAGDTKAAAAMKMPGLQKFSNVTMKKGVFKDDNKFWEWFDKIKTNTIERIAVTITLQDEANNSVMVWTLANAWPTKITGTDLKAQGNEVAVETIEIAHEGLTISLK